MQQQWQKPSAGRVKCNVDGAWFDQQSQCGLGICIRDHEGHFLKEKSAWFDGYLKPQEIEAMGLLEALRWLTQLGVHDVDIELDCKQVVDAFNGGSKFANEFRAIISSCKKFFSHFQNCAISYIRR